MPASGYKYSLGALPSQKIAVEADPVPHLMLDHSGGTHILSHPGV